MKEKTKERTLTLLEAAGIMIAYIPGLIVAIWFWLGCFCRRITILHKERLPKSLVNTVVPIPHPAVPDPFLVAGLLSPYYLRHPLTQAPLIGADLDLFYNNPLMKCFQGVMWPINRKVKSREALSVREMRKALRPKFICPEGKRTFRGKPGEWLYCEGGNDQNEGRMLPLKSGVGYLIQDTNATALPIAIVGSQNVVPNSEKSLWTYFDIRGKMVMVVGKPMTFDPELNRKEVTQQISDALLKLMSEALEYIRKHNIRRS